MDPVRTEQPPQKKPYSSPKLTCFGAVQVLTQAQTTGSMEGSGGSGVQMATCERHLKERVSRIGEHPLGIGLYLFEYKPEFQHRYGRGRQFGVMVDEVEAVAPSTITLNDRGHKTVNLTMLGISRPAH